MTPANVRDDAELVKELLAELPESMAYSLFRGEFK